MSPSRWLSLLLAWTLLLHSLAPALASPRPLRANTPTQSTAHALSENRTHHQYLVDTSQPYAEVIQERAWASNVSGTQIGDSLIYRYDIGLDRLHYFKYQMPINGPPSLGSPVLSEWLLFDGLGSTRALVGDSGSVVDEFGYNDAFGIPYRVTANGSDRAVAPPGFFLNGQQWDGGSGWGGAGSIWSGSPAFNSGEGLYFNRARYYQPGLGRFVNQDPLLGDLYSADTLHRFFYAGNNPVSNIDPSGENFIETMTTFLIANQLNLIRIAQYSLIISVASKVASLASGYVAPGMVDTFENITNFSLGVTMIATMAGTIPAYLGGLLPQNPRLNPAPPATQIPPGPILGPDQRAHIDAWDKNEKAAENYLRNLERSIQATQLSNRQSHFFARHNAGIPAWQLQRRAMTGLTPDGAQGPIVDSTRFSSFQAQLRAIQLARHIHTQTGDNEIWLKYSSPVGDGYLRKDDTTLRSANYVFVLFKNGQPYTNYAVLRPDPTKPWFEND